MTTNAGDTYLPMSLMPVEEATFERILDTLGRWWTPALHPRDKWGRFIRTFSTIRYRPKHVSQTTPSFQGEALAFDHEGNVVMRVKAIDEGFDGNLKIGDKVLVKQTDTETRLVKALVDKVRLHKGRVKSGYNAARTADGLGLTIKTDMGDGKGFREVPLSDAIIRGVDLGRESGDEKKNTNNQWAVDTFREAGEILDREKARILADHGVGADDDWKKADLPGDVKAQLNRIEGAVGTMATLRHSLGDKQLPFHGQRGTTEDRNLPEERRNTARQIMIEAAANGDDMLDLTGGIAKATWIPVPQQEGVQVRDTPYIDNTRAPAKALAQLQRALNHKLHGGLTRLASANRSEQSTLKDRWDVDASGNVVTTGTVVQVQAATRAGSKRPDGTMVITRVATRKDPKTGKLEKFMLARHFDPDLYPGKNGYAEYEVTPGVISVIGLDEADSRFKELALQGRLGRSLAKAFGPDRLEELKMAYATADARRLSRYLNPVPPELRVASGIDGRLVRMGDWVSGPNGVIGVVSWMDADGSRARVQTASGQQEIVIAPAFLAKMHTTADPDHADYVPTRGEAAAAARAVGSEAVARVIEDPASGQAQIQQAMHTDQDFLNALARFDQELDQREDMLTRGANPPKWLKQSLRNVDVLAAASIGDFRQPEPPATRPPAAPSADGVTDPPTSAGDQSSTVDADGTRTDTATGAETGPGESGTGTVAPAASSASKLLQDLSKGLEQAMGASLPDEVGTSLRSIRRYLGLMETAIAERNFSDFMRSVRAIKREVDRHPVLKPSRLGKTVNANIKLRSNPEFRSRDLVHYFEDYHATLGDGGVFGPVPSATEQRPGGGDVVDEDVSPAVDAATDALSKALLEGRKVFTGTDGSPLEDGFATVRDENSVAVFDQVPTKADIEGYLQDQDLPEGAILGFWRTDDGKFLVASFSHHADAESANLAASDSETNQFIDIASGQVFNVSSPTDEPSPTDKSSERAVEAVPGGRARVAKRTSKQSSVLQRLLDSDEVPEDVKSVVRSVMAGEALDQAATKVLDDFLQGSGDTPFDDGTGRLRSASKGVVQQLVDRVAEANGLERPRGYSSRNTALRRSSDVRTALKAATGGDGAVDDLMAAARLKVRKGDYDGAAEDFRAAADRLDAEFPGSEKAAARARAHADRMSRTSTGKGVPEDSLIPAREQAAPEGAAPEAEGPQLPPRDFTPYRQWSADDLRRALKRNGFSDEEIAAAGDSYWPLAGLMADFDRGAVVPALADGTGTGTGEESSAPTTAPEVKPKPKPNVKPESETVPEQYAGMSRDELMAEAHRRGLSDAQILRALTVGRRKKKDATDEEVQASLGKLLADVDSGNVVPELSAEGDKSPVGDLNDPAVLAAAMDEALAIVDRIVDGTATPEDLVRAVDLTNTLENHFGGKAAMNAAFDAHRASRPEPRVRPMAERGQTRTATEVTLTGTQEMLLESLVQALADDPEWADIASRVEIEDRPGVWRTGDVDGLVALLQEVAEGGGFGNPDSDAMTTSDARGIITKLRRPRNASAVGLKNAYLEDVFAGDGWAELPFDAQRAIDRDVTDAIAKNPDFDFQQYRRDIVQGGPGALQRHADALMAPASATAPAAAPAPRTTAPPRKGGIPGLNELYNRYRNSEDDLEGISVEESVNGEQAAQGIGDYITTGRAPADFVNWFRKDATPEETLDLFQRVLADPEYQGTVGSAWNVLNKFSREGTLVPAREQGTPTPAPGAAPETAPAAPEAEAPAEPEPVAPEAAPEAAAPSGPPTRTKVVSGLYNVEYRGQRFEVGRKWNEADNPTNTWRIHPLDDEGYPYGLPWDYEAPSMGQAIAAIQRVLDTDAEAAAYGDAPLDAPEPDAPETPEPSFVESGLPPSDLDAPEPDAPEDVAPAEEAATGATLEEALQQGRDPFQKIDDMGDDELSMLLGLDDGDGDDFNFSADAFDQDFIDDGQDGLLRAPATVNEADAAMDSVSKFPPTDEQRVVTRLALQLKNIVVRALAGSGKTSTLELIARASEKADPARRFLYVAFNKAIQLEAAKRMPGNTEARTADSLAWAAMPKGLTDKKDSNTRNGSNPAAVVDTKAMAKYFGAKKMGEKSAEDIIRDAQRTAAKYMISDDDTITAKHVTGAKANSPEGKEILRIARAMWDDYTDERGNLPFTNSIATKIWALSRPDLRTAGKKGAQVLFWDEAQDINPVLARILVDMAAIDPETGVSKMQIIVVGDENQAIYGFRGATDLLQQIMLDHDLPLTKSWRFGPQVAAVGNMFLDLLDPERKKYRVEGGGPQGTIVEAGIMIDAEAVLARSNGGAIAEIFVEIERGRSVGSTKRFVAMLREVADTIDWLKAGGGETYGKKLQEDLSQYRNWGELMQDFNDGKADQNIQKFVRISQNVTTDEMRQMARNLIVIDDPSRNDVPDAENLVTSNTGQVIGRGLKTSFKGGKPYDMKYWADDEGNLRIHGTPTGVSGGDRAFGVFKSALEAKAKSLSSSSRARYVNKANAAGTGMDTPQGHLHLSNLDKEQMAEILKWVADTYGPRDWTAPEPPDVVVVTAHLSKGLEWKKVRIADDFRGPEIDKATGKMIMPSDEEKRLAYVAVTRAMETLDPGSLSWVFDYAFPDNLAIIGRGDHEVKGTPADLAAAAADDADAEGTSTPEVEPFTPVDIGPKARGGDAAFEPVTAIDQLPIEGTLPRNVKRQLDKLPAATKTFLNGFLRGKGASIIFSRDGLEDAIGHLEPEGREGTGADHRSIKEVNGAYNTATGHIIISDLETGNDDSDMLHEIGHAVDYGMGEYLGTGPLSSHRAFTAAYKQLVDASRAGGGNSVMDDYLMHSSVALDGENSNGTNGIRETFAQVYQFRQRAASFLGRGASPAQINAAAAQAFLNAHFDEDSSYDRDKAAAAVVNMARYVAAVEQQMDKAVSTPGGGIPVHAEPVDITRGALLRAPNAHGEINPGVRKTETLEGGPGGAGDGTNYQKLPATTKKWLQGALRTFGTAQRGRATTMRKMASNLVDSLSVASPGELRYGGAWYASARDFAQSIAARGGWHLTAAVIAGTSPKTRWEANMVIAQLVQESLDPDTSPVIDDEFLDTPVLSRGKKVSARDALYANQDIAKEVGKRLELGSKVKPSKEQVKEFVDAQLAARTADGGAPRLYQFSSPAMRSALINTNSRVKQHAIELAEGVDPTGKGLTYRPLTSDGYPTNKRNHINGVMSTQMTAVNGIYNYRGNDGGDDPLMPEDFDPIPGAQEELYSNISRGLGGHKTRSFYNNIVTGGESETSVTIDTHMLDAMILGVPATRSGVFASGKTEFLDLGQNTAEGRNGTYPIFQEASRMAMRQLGQGWTMAKVQSVAWLTTLGSSESSWVVNRGLALHAPDAVVRDVLGAGHVPDANAIVAAHRGTAGYKQANKLLDDDGVGFQFTADTYGQLGRALKDPWVQFNRDRTEDTTLSLSGKTYAAAAHIVATQKNDRVAREMIETLFGDGKESAEESEGVSDEQEEAVGAKKKPAPRISLADVRLLRKIGNRTVSLDRILEPKYTAARRRIYEDYVDYRESLGVPVTMSQRDIDDILARARAVSSGSASESWSTIQPPPATAEDWISRGGTGPAAPWVPVPSTPPAALPAPGSNVMPAAPGAPAPAAAPVGP